VLRFFLGELSETTLLTKAEESGADQTRRDRLCEARFYAGMAAHVQHRDAHGVALLRVAADKCHPGFIESIAARWVLRAKPVREN
jgi:lipoprotein NlpI